MNRFMSPLRHNPAVAVVLSLFSLQCFATNHAVRDEKPEFTRTESGLQYAITKHGTGPAVRAGEAVVFNYVGRLENGTVFYSTRGGASPEPAVLEAGGLSSLPKGVQEGLKLLHVGDHATLIVPPQLGYGARSLENIPPGSTLYYDIEVVALKTKQLSSVMLETINSKGLGAARKVFESLRAEGFADVVASSGELNYLGYGYLYRYVNSDVAIALLRWNLELYPRSAELEDSLGEAYFASGNRAGAIQHYERALRLAPNRQSTAQSLASLKNNPASPTELERLRMYLTHAPAFAGELAKTPINVESLRIQLEHYLAHAPLSESAEAAREVTRFLHLVDAEKERAQKALYERLEFSPMGDVRRALGLAREVDRETSEARRSIAGQLKEPVEIAFTALDGRAVDLAVFRGKVVLVQFWAAWSAASVREIPGIVSAYEKYHDKGFEVIGVSIDQSPDGATAQQKELKRTRISEEVRAFTRDNKMSWPQFYDGTGADNIIAKQFWVRTAPTMFLVDQRGMLVGAVGAPELDRELQWLLEPAFGAATTSSSVPDK